MSDAAAYDQRADRLGKYRLIAVLARGGMGDVYLATADGIAGFSKLLVVKELRAEQADDDIYVNMFMDEARLAARLSHPNIVQTIEVGSDGARRFMVMEYLEGQPLHRMLRRARRDGPALTIGLRMRVLADILDALSYAHTLTEFDGNELGIVHRDVSPQNVFLTYDGHVKLIDFGIAKTRLSSQQTSVGVLKGKVRYMAPEQARGQVVDSRTDVFSCGVILWEMLVGSGPWEGRSDLQILEGLMRNGLPQLADAPADVPASLVAVVNRAIRVTPGDRYPTARAMRDAILASTAPANRDDFRDEQREALTRHFSTERRELGALVDAQIRGMSSHGSLEVASLTRMRAAEEPISLNSPGSDLEGESSDVAVPISSPSLEAKLVVTSISELPRARHRGRTLFVLAGAAVGMLASAALLLGLTKKPPERRPEDVKTTVAPTPPSPTTPVNIPAPASVAIHALPSTASIYVDGVLVANPYAARLPRDNGVHTLTVSAPGYLAKTRSFSANADIELEIALEREPAVHGGLRGPVEPASRSSVPSSATPTAKSASPPSPEAPAPRTHRHRDIDKEDPYAQ